MKLFTYLIILTGLSLLLGFAGINTGAGIILQNLHFVTSPSDFAANSSLSYTGFTTSSNDGSLSGLIYALFALGTVGIVFIGIFTSASPDSLLKLPICAFLLATFTSDFINVLVFMQSLFQNSWFSIFMTLLYVPLLVGFLITLVDWWSGFD